MTTIHLDRKGPYLLQTTLFKREQSIKDAWNTNKLFTHLLEQTLELRVTFFRVRTGDDELEISFNSTQRTLLSWFQNQKFMALYEH